MTESSQMATGVDPHCNDAHRCSLYTDGDGCTWDCMLVRRDLRINMDRFYTMQILNTQGRPGSGILLFRRYGRTGQAGRIMHTEVPNLERAKRLFKSRFRSKTGRAWGDAAPPSRPPGMYRSLNRTYAPQGPSVDSDPQASPQAAPQTVTWQYWVDDHVDGKSVGWYDYEVDASRIVENIHTEWLNNSDFSVRSVKSGEFCYHVDFNDMTQTNVVLPSGRVRRIRRHVHTAVQ
jgi:predicted DNA-binding WGR domain protein